MTNPFKLKEEGKAVNFLDETISINKIQLRRTLYRKTGFIIVAGAPLSNRPSFPNHDSKLIIRSKYGIVTGEMVRFLRRDDTKTDFIKYTVQMITKMVRFRYSRRRLLTKVRSFGYWPKKLGKWSSTRRRILLLLDDIWHTQQQQ